MYRSIRGPEYSRVVGRRHSIGSKAVGPRIGPAGAFSGPGPANLGPAGPGPRLAVLAVLSHRPSPFRVLADRLRPGTMQHQRMRRFAPHLFVQFGVWPVPTVAGCEPISGSEHNSRRAQLQVPRNAALASKPLSADSVADALWGALRLSPFAGRARCRLRESTKTKEKDVLEQCPSAWPLAKH